MNNVNESNTQANKLTCKECFFQGPKMEFNLEGVKFDIYECSECLDQEMATRDESTPRCHNRNMNLIEQKEFDIVRCPKCNSVVDSQNNFIWRRWTLPERFLTMR
jgi:hypothetical protein